MHADADQGKTPFYARNQVTATPPKDTLMEDDAATVGVDVNAMAIRPDFARHELFEGLCGLADCQRRGEEDGS